jgi:hypothetical protein
MQRVAWCHEPLAEGSAIVVASSPRAVDSRHRNRLAAF